jgi:spermidine synthase
MAITDLRETQAAAAPPAEHRRAFRLRVADALVPVLFMASGAAGLVYQIVWTRELVLVFGNTTQAVVTTVTAFLGGLGTGALLGGWLSRRMRRPLVVYGGLELGVGCVALLMPWAFSLVATVFRSAYLSLPAGEVAFIRFLLAFVALAPVTVMMGMTLPVLTRHLVRRDPDIGGRIARLYGLNTLGAVMGTFAAGFALIGLLGLRETTYVGVALNVCAGLGALTIAFAIGAGQGAELKPVGDLGDPGDLSDPGDLADQGELSDQGGPALDATHAGSAPAHRARRARKGARLSGKQGVLLGVTALSGLTSLALEVLWTRVLILGTGSAIYIFSAILGVFLLGIAIGSLVFEQVKRYSRVTSMPTLGACFVAAGMLALLPVIISNRGGPSALHHAIALILPVTLILGFAFPLTVRLFVDHAPGASRGVGLVYASNTAGCVAGTVLAGFVLVPTLGANISVATLCIVQVVVGAVLIVCFVTSQRALYAAAALVVVGGLLVSLSAPSVRLTFIQKYDRSFHQPTAHFEDNIAAIDVVGGPAYGRRLFVNGVGITRLTIVTKLIAYLPKALRPNATSNLNICFGMGSTFRSSIILGMHTTTVELDPTVPTVMHWFYPDANKYLHSPLAHVVIGDGRNYVRLTNKKFDMITIDAPPPVTSAGTVVLMTHEFYQEAAQRLNPGGVLVAFLPYTSPTLQKLFLRTFRASFRYMMVIAGLRQYGYYSIGSDAPLVFHKATIERIFGSPAAQADLAGAPDWPGEPVSTWPALIEHHILLTNDQVDTFVGPGPLLTDDRPISEYYLLHS